MDDDDENGAPALEAPAGVQDGPPSGRPLAVVAVAVAVVSALAAHGAGIANGFVLPRDEHLLLAHDRWHALDGDRLSWMLDTARGGTARPLAWMSLALDASIGGPTPVAVHVGAVLLHALSAALLALLFVRLLDRRGPTGGDPHPRRHSLVTTAAALAAAAWAAHPLRVESVAWASARGELLATLFGIGSALALERGVGGREVRPLAALTSLGLATLAVMADPAALGVPVALVALTLWLRVDRPQSVAGWAGGASLAGSLLGLLVPLGLGLAVSLAEGTAGVPGTPLPAVAVAACGGVIRALRTTLLPIGLVLDPSPPPDFPDTLDPALWLDVGLAGLLVGATLFGVRRLSGSSLVGLAFLGALVPQILLGHAPFGADRFSALPTVALFLGAATLFVDRPLTTGVRRAVVVGASLVVLTLAGLAVRETRHWRDDATLTTHTLSLDPTNEQALVSRAQRVRRGGAPWTEWIALQNHALEGGGRRPLAEWWYGRGLLESGDVAAETYLGRAVAHGPWLPGPLHDLGSLELRRGNADAAAELLRRAVRLDQLETSIWFALGRAELLRDDVPAAVRALRRAAELSPGETVIQRELERALQR